MQSQRPFRHVALVRVASAALTTLLLFHGANGADASKEDVRKQIRELQETQQKLLDQIRRELAALPSSSDAPASQNNQQDQRREQLLQLLSEIERRINEEGTGPRKRYVAASTREVAFHEYYSRFKSRVEEEGTKDFPNEDGRKIYGQVKMLLTLSSKGAIESIEVLISNSPKLSIHSEKLIKRLAPFERFSKDMAKTADQVVIFVPFNYHGDGQ